MDTLTLDDGIRVLNEVTTDIDYICFPSLDIKYKLPKTIKIPNGLSDNQRIYFIICNLLGLEEVKIERKKTK